MHMPSSKIARVLALLLLASFFSGAGCKSGNEYVPPPAPKVEVGKPELREVTEYLEFTGNTQAKDSVDLRARVEGFLVKQAYVDGTDVKKGQLLFLIEPEPYEAKVLEAKAQIASQQARLERAEIETVRAKKLFAEKAGPDTDVVKWQAERDEAKAALESAKAQLEIAKINLSYTKVNAPFDGRVSKRNVDVGNLVGATEKTLLATIISYDPMYVYFTLAERDLLRLMNLKEYDEKGDPQGRVPLEMGFSNSNGYPLKGVMDYHGLGVDPKTGTILLRGIFSNKDDKIAPGLFARVRAPLSKRKALLVPDTAVAQDQTGHYVLLLNEKSVVEQRPIKVGFAVDGMLVVESGLKGEERVILSGLQRVRAGSPAESVEASAKKAPAAGPKS